MMSLGVIHARGGSRRIPRKNVRPLRGTPLIAYLCRAAVASSLDRVILSTDDAEIAEAAAANGVDVPFRRPDELAEDVPSERVTLHALDWVERNESARYDVCVTMQPTTPYVLADDIDACLATLMTTDASCCFTARRAVEPPQWMFVETAEGNAEPMLPGRVEGERGVFQSLPPSYLPNGAAYATRTEALRAQQRILCEPCRMLVMPAERSVDLDEPIDWTIAEAVGEAHGFAPAALVREGPAVNVFKTSEAHAQ